MKAGGGPTDERNRESLHLRQCPDNREFRILADGQVDSGVIRYSYNYASLSWENHGEVIRLTNQELRERFQNALSRWLSFSDTLVEREIYGKPL